MNIILITDIYGSKKSQWLDKYVSIFQNKKDNIIIYDSTEIGKIDKSITDKNKIHKQFISFGIKNAVTFLLDKKHESSIYIGFSIGGFIAWEAISSGLNALALYCISSTRIRYKREPIGIPVKLIYGDLDLYKPDLTCLKQLDVNYDIILKSRHDLYKLYTNIPMLTLNFYQFIDENFVSDS